MRRHGQLFEAFVSFPNLLSAYKKARKGTRSNQESSRFFFLLEPELLGLQEELVTLAYQPAPYRYFQVYDPKERTISVAAFRDRVVHHALVNVLEPIYERIFIFDSYATRKGKGTHLAVSRAQSFLRRHPWFFKTDIDKYFDSIRQETLLAIIERKVKDERLLEITERIIHNGGQDGVGLPIGNLTSQFFANVYLDRFDHFVKQELRFKGYLRYMDDLVCFSPERAKLKAALPEIRAFLDDELHLKLKEKATFFNSASNGLTFLGRRIFPNLVRLARANLRRTLRRMRKREWEFRNGLIGEDTFIQSMSSSWGLLSKHDTLQLRRSLLKEKG